MKPIYTLAAVGLAFAVTFTEEAPLYAHAEKARCQRYCYAAVLQERPRFDVGSRGPGYGFLEVGPSFLAITPMP